MVEHCRSSWQPRSRRHDLIARKRRPHSRSRQSRTHGEQSDCVQSTSYSAVFLGLGHAYLPSPSEFCCRVSRQMRCQMRVARYRIAACGEALGDCGVANKPQKRKSLPAHPQGRLSAGWSSRLHWLCHRRRNPAHISRQTTISAFAPVGGPSASSRSFASSSVRPSRVISACRLVKRSLKSAAFDLKEA